MNYVPRLQVLREGKEFEDLTEVAKLFNLYGDLEKEAETETQESTEAETETQESTETQPM